MLCKLVKSIFSLFLLGFTIMFSPKIIVGITAGACNDKLLARVFVRASREAV